MYQIRPKWHFFSVNWAFPTVFISMLEEEDFLKSWPSRVSHTRGPQPLKKNARMSTTHVPFPCLQIVKDSFFSAMLTGLLLLGLGFAENAKKHVIINYVFSFSLSRAAETHWSKCSIPILYAIQFHILCNWIFSK